MPFFKFTKLNNNAQKNKVSIKNYSRKCHQIRSFLRIWQHLLKKSLKETFFFWHCWSCFFIIVRNCSFLAGIIFCSSVVLVRTFNTKGVYNFITTEANFGSALQWYLVPILSLLYVWSEGWAKNPFLLKSKKVRVICSKQEKPLLLGKR